MVLSEPQITLIENGVNGTLGSACFHEVTEEAGDILKHTGF